MGYVLHVIFTIVKVAQMIMFVELVNQDFILIQGVVLQMDVHLTILHRIIVRLVIQDIHYQVGLVFYVVFLIVKVVQVIMYVGFVHQDM